MERNQIFLKTKTPTPRLPPRLRTVDPLSEINAWFESRGWQAFDFQKRAWAARYAGESGLIHVPTGAGKTYAAFLGALAVAMREAKLNGVEKGLKIVYVTPLKAVARDIRLSLEEAVKGLGLPFRVEDRTGDTKASQRSKQKLAMPDVLVTTPESLAVLLCDTDHERHFTQLQSIILDEWHECLSSKRGSLLELTLTRLRRLRPEMATWAMTATIANVLEAAEAAVGAGAGVEAEQSSGPTIIRAEILRPLIIESLVPDEIDAFPWAGQLGLRLLPKLLAKLDPQISTLIFANTRGQAERWYQAIGDAKPGWQAKLALHHGSLAPKERERVESGLKSGEISIVISTSSLDLGVDFGPVEKVVQLGSPKGVARLLQRAGRSAHRPGATANLLFVPTNPLELIEIAAVRRAAAAGRVEARHPIPAPLDVLVQHLITRAVGGGYSYDEIAAEVRTAYSFRNLRDEDLQWGLLFVQCGGVVLQSYPAYRKVLDEDGVFRVRDPKIARLHKMSIGTIASDATIDLKFQRGKTIGQVEESFVSKLKKGDRFLFSGRTLVYLGMRDLVATVKLGSGSVTVFPKFSGSRLPYSRALSTEVRATLEDWHRGHTDEPEAKILQPILKAQEALSALPERNELLVEIVKSKQGHHLFLYPFEGRPVHEGLGSLLALRLARGTKATFTISMNDFGIELLSADEFDFESWMTPDLFAPIDVREDLSQALDLTQLAKQKFREVARVAGLIHPGNPSAKKTNRQLQVSAGLLFDVFRRYEPGHPLIHQAETEVLRDQLDDGRLSEILERLSRATPIIRTMARPTPLAFSLMAERLAARLSSETLSDRLNRMKAEWTRA